MDACKDQQAECKESKCGAARKSIRTQQLQAITIYSYRFIGFSGFPLDNLRMLLI